jgi:histidyl-tRNA synthetase
VTDEMKSKGISNGAIEKLLPVLELKGGTKEKIGQLEKILAGSEIGLHGVAELKTLFDLSGGASLKCQTELDLTLARGLNYYTGAIIEVKSKDVAIGSICGGGRYDNLTGIFGLDGVSGVGVSFGADRIYDVMTSLGLFDSDKTHTSTAMIVNFGGTEAVFGLSLLNDLHDRGIAAEIYPDAIKMKKQMSWADSKKIPFVIIAGDEEIRNNEVTVKNMQTGDQARIKVSGLGDFILSS